MPQIQGRVAVITGAASGIGLATARLFASEGAQVVATDVAEQGLADLARETDVVPVTGDVAKSDDVDRIVGTATERFGRRLDILCNVAGIFDRYLAVDEMPDDVWRRVLDVNLTGSFQMCRRALPLMLSNGSGAIVNVSSIAGLVGSRGGAAYTVSKHGLIMPGWFAGSSRPCLKPARLAARYRAHSAHQVASVALGDRVHAAG